MLPPLTCTAITHLDRVDSTQLYAKREVMARPPAPHTWHFVQARKQTAGYGTHGRQWVSPAGNLYLTGYTCLPARFPVCLSSNTLSTTPLVAALSVLDVLNAHMPTSPFQIKWVNDILCHQKKCAGILCETAPCPHRPHHTILYIGIGINRILPPAHTLKIDQACTSLSAICAPTLPPLTALSHSIMTHLPHRIAQLIEHGFACLHTTIQSHLAFLSETVHFQPPPPYPSPLIGRFKGINTQGHLLLEHPTCPGPFINGRLYGTRYPQTA